ncbi:hypothetical protein ACJRO7_014379 [Eucalyptus globulus]|uniref:Disease resistance R13L4/SHOC-2-like LRR domain-containing protein n=1 Tax=Eucalyptus globulus TaxID=34317 RepID=A0ABD3L0W6_EUCGL
MPIQAESSNTQFLHVSAGPFRGRGLLRDSLRSNLSSLDLSGTSIAELPISIGELMQLEFLSLSHCQNFLKLPESIGYLTKLQMLDLSGTKIIELPNSIKNLKQLKVMRMASCPIQRLPAGIGMLESMEELDVRNCQQLAGELPTAIGELLSLSILDISQTSVCAVPTTINYLTRLQKLNLSFCDKVQELPELPLSLNCLRVKWASLQLVPDLSYLTNLVVLELSNNSGQALAQASTLQLQWVGKLSKLEQLELCLLDLPVPSTELGCLSRLKTLTLPRMDSFDSEGAAWFFERGQPLIVQEDARETDAEESVMETNNYYSQNLSLTIGFLWSPEPDTELDSTMIWKSYADDCRELHDELPPEQWRSGHLRKARAGINSLNFAETD